MKKTPNLNRGKKRPVDSSSQRKGKRPGTRSKKTVEKKSNAFQLVIGIVLVFLVFFRPQEKAFSSSHRTDESGAGHVNSRMINQEGSSSEANVIKEEGPLNDTAAIGSVSLDSSQLGTVAKSIYRVANGISEEFEVADGITTAMYLLRYFAEIGEFEISQADILKLVNVFVTYTGLEVEDEVISIINQIRKIKFGKREGKFFSQFYSVQPVKGIVIDINEVSEDPNSSVKEIERFVMEEGSILFFEEVDTAAEKKLVRDFVKTPIKLLGLVDLDSIKDSLYQVHPDLIEGIDDYLEWDEVPAPTMMVEMRNMYVTVDTSTVLNQIKFDFHSAYVFPGINLEGDPVPSIVLGAKAKLLNLKVSIDQ